ncbi:APA family basic amino acid/polyamine antiporter [Bacilli bacterium PM5-3]|nr:APA family basic amino acid/polyamine antiporter [Bacilli bacterium PM5-3]
MENHSSTKELKQVLGFSHLLTTAIGQIIGAGIMTLLGAAIAMTGRSVPIAFVIAAVLTVLVLIPLIIISGTVRVRGGQYTMVGLLAGEKMAGVFVILFIASNISMAMYGISFANYFIPFFGVGTTKVVAITVLTIFFVLNVFGIDKMAKFQTLIVLLLCIALGIFAAFGFGQISPDYLTQDFYTDGISGLLKASGLLTFAIGGAFVIVNLSAEAKNPTRDIPLAMIVSTFIVAIIYALVGIVASGVLPVSQVAGESLNVVANQILPKAAYAFFMVCGAMFALISTINAQYAWATKPILQACDDGWLPKKLAYLHPKFKTPVVLLGILYVIAIVCIITGLDISILGNLSVITTQLVFAIIGGFLWKLPKVVPLEWEKSKYKVGYKMIVFLSVISCLAALVNVYLNAIQLTTALVIGNVVLVVVAYIYAAWRVSTKKVNMTISYESE